MLGLLLDGLVVVPFVLCVACAGFFFSPSLFRQQDRPVACGRALCFLGCAEFFSPMLALLARHNVTTNRPQAAHPA